MPISAADEARATTESAGVRLRDDLTLLRVSGDDRIAWLNGQVTNDVRVAVGAHAVYALAVTVRGKIMADLWVLDRGAELAVLLPRAAQARVIESFEPQIIMEDVTLIPDPATCVVSIQGPRARELVSALAGTSVESYSVDELGLGGMFVLVNEPEIENRLAELTAAAERLGGSRLGQAGFDLLRLRAGRGIIGVDFDEQNYPQEAGLKQLAVSFNKGCYLGQEVVCTLENRGRLTKRLVRLEAADGSTPETGLELSNTEGQAVGHLTSVVRDPDLGRSIGLGYVKAAFAAPGTQLRAGDSVLSVLTLAGND